MPSIQSKHVVKPRHCLKIVLSLAIAVGAYGCSQDDKGAPTETSDKTHAPDIVASKPDNIEDILSTPEWTPPEMDDWETPALPLGAAAFPNMAPPELKTFATAPAPLMHWYKGPIEVPGYKAGWFRTNELTLYYVEGENNGPPLVFFPGQAVSWHEHQDVMGLLAEHFHVFVMEHRGHGFSERSKQGKYRPVDYVTDAAAFIEHVVGEPAIITGHSLGGTMVIAMADLHPDKIIGASIEDAPFFLNESMLENTGWLDNMLFGPFREVRRRHQIEGAGTVELAQILNDAAAYLPPGDYAQPSSEEVRRYFVNETYGGIERILAPLEPRDRAFYQANWDRYFKEGIAGPNKNYFPIATMDMRLSTPSYARVDWRTSVPQATGRWHDGFDERRGLSKMNVPTIHWHADRRLVPLHSEAQIDEAKAIRQELDAPYEYIEAIGCQHSIHGTCTEQFAQKMIEFFGEL